MRNLWSLSLIHFSQLWAVRSKFCIPKKEDVLVLLQGIFRSHCKFLQFICGSLDLIWLWGLFIVCCVFRTANGCFACPLLAEILFLAIKTSFSITNGKKEKVQKRTIKHKNWKRDLPGFRCCSFVYLLCLTIMILWHV